MVRMTAGGTERPEVRGRRRLVHSSWLLLHTNPVIGLSGNAAYLRRSPSITRPPACTSATIRQLKICCAHTL